MMLNYQTENFRGLCQNINGAFLPDFPKSWLNRENLFYKRGQKSLRYKSPEIKRATKETQSLDYSRLDFNAFMAFKRFRLRKDSQLKTRLIEITKDLMVNKPVFDVLDVGTGDGELIYDVLKHANKLVNPSHTVRLKCVEPALQAVELLRNLQSKSSAFKVSSTFYLETVQSYLNQRHYSKYDLITCIHSLYHISIKEWEKVYEGLREKLKSDGKIITVLASNKGILYKPLQLINSKLDSSRLYSEYGLDIFAEDFIDFLNRENRSYSIADWDAPLTFTSEEVKEVFSYNLNTSLSTPAVFWVFSFLYRLPVSQVQTLLRQEIQNMLEACLQADGSAIIPMHEACISIGEKN